MFVTLRPTAPEPDRPRARPCSTATADSTYPHAGTTHRALAWVEAGGVYAVANLRGGGEEGEDWHRDGMREHKQNVFDDFHAAAEWLIAEGWTTPSQLAVCGGSNGGLLVGAALTQRPGALRARSSARAPLLDMVRYERFGLGATWNDEYGTAADPERARLAALLLALPPRAATGSTTRRCCSPCSTATPGSTRCTPARSCAALQHATAADAPVLLRREKDVGHGARA